MREGGDDGPRGAFPRGDAARGEDGGDGHTLGDVVDADGECDELALGPSASSAERDADAAALAEGVRSHDAHHQEGLARVRAAECGEFDILLAVERALEEGDEGCAGARAEDDQDGAVGLALVHEIERGGEHDPARQGVGQRGDAGGEPTDEKEGDSAEAAHGGHDERQEEHRAHGHAAVHGGGRQLGRRGDRHRDRDRRGRVPNSGAMNATEDLKTADAAADPGTRAMHDRRATPHERFGAARIDVLAPDDGRALCVTA